MSEERLHFDPSENALEFLIDAAEGLAGNPTKKQLKYATLHLVAAVEILFKVRLEEEHWTLLLPKFGRQQQKGELELFRSGLLPTVGAEEAARRLRDVVGLQIPDAIPGLKPLMKIRTV